MIATRDTQAISDLACCPPSAGSDWARKLGARSYLGVPLLTPQGEVSGAFYVLDVHPRDWCADDLEVLPELAALAQSHVAMRQVARQAIRRAEAAQSQDEFLALVADEAPCLLWFAEVTETGEDALAWRVEVTEAAAQRFFPVTRAPGQRYVSAWYASRLTEDRARTDAFGHAQIRAGRSYHQEFRCRRADGTIRWLSEHVRVKSIAEGRWQIMAVTTDVTDQKTAEGSLRESEERMQFALEAAGAHLWEVSLHTGEVWYSANTPEILGVPREVLGTHHASLLELIHPDDRHLLAQEPARDGQLSDKVDNEFRIMRLDGTIGWMLGKGRIISDESGQPYKVTGIGIDITERKRVVTALAEREEQLRLVFDAANLVVWNWDTVSGSVGSPEAVKRLFGYSAEECEPVYEWWVSHLHPEDRDRVLQQTEAHLASGAERWGHEYRFQRADGTYATVNAHVQAIRAAAGELIRLVGAMLDVSAERELQSQFFQAQKMEAVGRLAGGVAHDFNNLLSVINGYTEILLPGTEEGSLARLGLGEIREAGERSARLTRQLLVFSRKQIVAPRPLDVSEVLEGMHAMLRRIIGEDVELVTHCQRPVGLVQADAGQIEQVLMNLAVNSRDAMPDGGTLTFRVQNIEVPVAAGPVEAGAYVQLSVTDTGSGISPEVLPHIFEPFFTTKEAGRGTGLGLATIYGIVTQAGGHIEVTSEKGRGTTFTVLLPCLPAQTVAARRGASSQQLARGSERILVVEDEEMVRGVVCAMLGRCGYEVLQASRAEEALDTCARHEGRIDLLLTDVVLQGANGRVLADEIKARYPDIRVVFMSGYTDDAVVRSGVLRAEVDFLQKPLTATALTRKVREVLDRGR